MKILHTEWSDGWGGQERRILLEMRGMAARGHTILLATRTHCWIAEEARKIGIPVTFFAMRGKFDLRTMIQLARFLRQQGVDLVHTHSGIDSWIGALAGWLAGVPVVRTRHLYLPLKRSGLNLVHFLTDRVFCLGENMRAMLVEECGFPPEAVINIPSGTDFSRFVPDRTRAEIRSELGIPEAAFLVLMVGVIRGVKRHDIALEAFARLREALPDAHFVIAGDGPMRGEMEQLAERLGIAAHTHFLGHRTDVANLMGAADVLLLTSRSEAQSQALTQGIGLGLPVVATAVGGVPEVILHEQTGLLVPPNDVAATTAALLRIARDPALAKQLGEAGVRHALAHYSLETMLDRTEQACAALLAEKGRR